MARYCFYCGRELAPDEKCDCRTRSAGASSAPPPPPPPPPPPKSGASGGPKASSAPPPPPPKTGPAKAPKPPHAKPTRRPPPPRPPRSPGSAGRFWKARLSEAGGFLVRPATTIRSVASAGTPGVPWLYVLLHALVAAAATAALSGRATAQGFVAFLLTGGISWVAPGADLARVGPSLAAVVFASVLVQYLALAGLLALALRFLLRTPAKFARVFAAAGPAAFYGAVFTLVAFLSSLGAAVPATHVLLVGLLIGTVAWFLGLSSSTGQMEDRTFFLLLFVLLVFAALLSAVSAALPGAFPAAATPSPSPTPGASF